MADKNKPAKDKPKPARPARDEFLKTALKGRDRPAAPAAPATRPASAKAAPAKPDAASSSGDFPVTPSKSGSYVPPPLPDHTVHVVVIGRTVAGLAAALGIARRELSVILLDADGPQPVGLAADMIWTSQAGFSAVKDLELGDKLDWRGPAGVHFVHASQDKYTTVDHPPKVCMVKNEALLTALERGAAAAGVKRQKSIVTKILLKDNLVQVHLLGGGVICAALLINADNSVGKQVLDAAHLTTPLMTLQPNWTLYRLILPSRTPRSAELAIVVGWRGSPLLGSAWTDGYTGMLALPEAGPSGPEPAAKLVATMVAKKILPAGAALDPVSIQRRSFLPGSSLDFEQHFGKRCVLAGQCGGFSAALSGEAVYAGLRSGTLAGEVCAKAWECRHSQDILSQFDTQWRTKLADYVRLPNTDLSFILPVVFSNQQMAVKIAAGFINGENL